MADRIPLPESVESLLQQIASEKSLPLPETPARRELASLGEEASLRVLSDIRKAEIIRTFDGFIIFLAKQYRTPGSPGNFASPAPPGVVLPASVEEVIGSICHEKLQPPLGTSARRKLALLGEDEALRLLYTIRRSDIIRSFDAFVIYLMKKDSPSSASPYPTPIRSLNFCALDGVSNSVQDRLTLSSISTARQPCTNNMHSIEQAPCHAANVGIPNEQTFSPSANFGSPGGPTFLPCINNGQSIEQTPSHTINIGIPNGQTLSPSTNLRKPGGPTFLHCINNRQSIEQAPSHTINVGIPNGQTLSPSTDLREPGGPALLPCINHRQSIEQAPSYTINVGIPNGQTLSPSTNLRKPGGPTFLPCIYNRQSTEQAPCHATNVGTPYGQAISPSTNSGKPNWHCVMPSTNIMNPSARALVPSTSASRPGEQTSSPVLQALHDLEFRKGFLILSYIGRNKLEEVISVDEIKDLATVQSMAVFENIIWDRFGSRYCEKKDRVKQADWESGRRYYYHCYVYSDGSYSLKGPFLNKTATLLQKVLGDENVLVVKFYDLDSSGKNFGQSVSYTQFCKVEEEGIYVGLKRFRFFVYKDGGKEEKKNSSSGAIKSYYVNVDSFARFYEKKASCFDMMSMHYQRCIFMHVHNMSSLSAYMARLSLILSKTITLEVNLDDLDVHVEVIDDMPCKDVNGVHTYDKDGKLQIHTDGTGFISEELALRCPQNCFKGTSLNERYFERYLEIVRPETSTGQFIPDTLQPPLLIQFRMFHKGCAVKGTVLVNKKLQGKRIQIRPSMIKVEPDHGLSCTPAVKSFEIVSMSNRPRKPRLSRNLIALLNYGGVPRDFFIGILVNEIWDAHNIFSNKRAALKVAINHGEMDDNYTVARMILSGIPLDESYIQLRLPILGKQELKSLKEGKLPIHDSFYVMGTTDPTGSLNSNEVCIIHETGQIEGDVLVYRPPGVHFGDVHILKATRVDGLEEVVGTSKYGIFFPTNGPRSLADKMAGGDFDGDMYFVSRHPKLLTNFKQSEPWTPTPLSCQSTSINQKPSEFTAEMLEHELFQLFLTIRFQPCNAAGMAANGWLSYMDKMLSPNDEQKNVDRLDLENKMLRLVDIYYEALDAPKKGKKVIVPRDLLPKQYPHFMGKANQYQSRSVLGEIFDKAEELKMETPAIHVGKLSRFDIEVPLRCYASWEDHYRMYRNEMSDALKSGNESKKDAATNVIQKYKQILYGTDEFEESPRAWEEIRFDALAIYHVVYGYAMQKNDAKKCGFAWKVAGPALIKIFIEEQDEKPIYCLPSVLRETL